MLSDQLASIAQSNIGLASKEQLENSLNYPGVLFSQAKGKSLFAKHKALTLDLIEHLAQLVKKPLINRQGQTTLYGVYSIFKTNSPIHFEWEFIPDDLDIAINCSAEEIIREAFRLHNSNHPVMAQSIMKVNSTALSQLLSIGALDALGMGKYLKLKEEGRQYLLSVLYYLLVEDSSLPVEPELEQARINLAFSPHQALKNIYLSVYYSLGFINQDFNFVCKNLVKANDNAITKFEPKQPSYLNTLYSFRELVALESIQGVIQEADQEDLNFAFAMIYRGLLPITQQTYEDVLEFIQAGKPPSKPIDRYNALAKLGLVIHFNPDDYVRLSEDHPSIASTLLKRNYRALLEGQYPGPDISGWFDWLVRSSHFTKNEVNDRILMTYINPPNALTGIYEYIAASLQQQDEVQTFDSSIYAMQSTGQLIELFIKSQYTSAQVSKFLEKYSAQLNQMCPLNGKSYQELIIDCESIDQVINGFRTMDPIYRLIHQAKSKDIAFELLYETLSKVGQEIRSQESRPYTECSLNPLRSLEELYNYACMREFGGVLDSNTIQQIINGDKILVPVKADKPIAIMLMRQKNTVTNTWSYGVENILCDHLDVKNNSKNSYLAVGVALIALNTVSRLNTIKSN